MASIALDMAKVAAQVLPFIGMVIAVGVSGYITMRLGPIKRKIDALAESLGSTNDRIAQNAREVESVRRSIPELPNCAAQEESLLRKIESLHSQQKIELLQSLAKIAEDNRKLRDQVLNEASVKVGDISSEFLSRDAIENMVEASQRHMREHELAEIFRRLGALERE